MLLHLFGVRATGRSRGGGGGARADGSLTGGYAGASDGARDGRHGDSQVQLFLQVSAHLVEFHVGFSSQQALQELIYAFCHGARTTQRLCLHSADGAMFLELCDLQIHVCTRYVWHGGADRHGRLALGHHTLNRRIVVVCHHRLHDDAVSCQSL